MQERQKKRIHCRLDTKLATKIKNTQLQNIYHKEEKMNATALKFLRRLTIPRIEILDVIYIYA